MKFLIFALAFVACSYADVSELGYNYHEPAEPVSPPKEIKVTYVPPVAPASKPVSVNTYVPPQQHQPAPAPVAVPVSVPVSNHIQPEPVSPHVAEPVNSYIPAVHAVAEQPLAPVEEIEQTGKDGYRYKAVRRVVFRHRS